MTTPETPTTREALAALLTTLPGCQYEMHPSAGRTHCGKRAVHGTASHQPTHCAEHAAVLGRGYVGTRTADWAEEAEEAERALAAGAVVDDEIARLRETEQLAKALGIHTGITWEEALIAVAAQRELAERPAQRKPPCSEEYVRLRELAIRTPYSVAELIDELETINRWRIAREPAAEGAIARERGAQ